VRAIDAAGNPSAFSNVASATTQTAPIGITLVQNANKDAGTTTSSSLAFATNNASGNWIGVAVRAGQTSQTISVTDTRGNTYRKAAQLNETVDGTTLAFYYAENIAGGANSVTVSDTIDGGTLRFAILEYAGIATASSLDAIAAAEGSSTAPNSGSATTTAGGNLIIGLVATANPATFTAGSGYVIQDRVPAAPNSKLIVEDRRQPTPGAAAVTVTLGATDNWGALLAAFKPATADTTSPTAPAGLATTVISDSQINLSWGAATDNVAVTNYLVERCAGVSCATFAQIGSATGLTFSSVGLLGSTPYSYRARASDAAGNLGPYSNTATATTPASPDTQAPTPPASLTALAISNSRIDLSWSASSDNVGVMGYRIEQCEGVGCGAFAQVGTTGGTVFSRLGLSNSTSYTFRVRAFDAASNSSAYSPTATATTTAESDTEAPTTPTALTATASSSSQIDLAWNPSSDNLAVTSYLIERCQGAGCSTFTQIATTPGTSYTNASLNGSTSYTYQVRAKDAAGNLSPYSSAATAVTPAAQDTQAPTPPTNLAASAVTSTQINLTWTSSTDNVGVTNYQVERCQGAGCSTFTQIGTTSVASFPNTGLTASTIYNYRVRATDAANNLSGYSNAATATTPANAVIAFVQSNYSAPQSSPTSVSVKYTLAQTGGNLNVVAVGWNSASGQVQSVTDTLGNTYVRAVGPTVSAGFATQSIYYASGIAPAAANANTVVVTFSGATPFPDIRIAEYAGIAAISPVDVVAAAQGSGTSSNSGSVTTTNAADLIVGANIVSSITTGPGASFTSRVITTPDGDILEDRIVAAVGSYSATAPLTSGSWIMQMVAFKGGSSAPDTTPPTAPGGLAAAALAEQQVRLTWTAATDNVAVTIYRIERCPGSGCSNFAEVGTASATATFFDDLGVVASTPYSYRVRAADAAGNLGVYSNVSSVTTPSPDTEPPSAPGQLTAVAASGTQVNLSWGAATDNVGVTGYRVEQCTGVGCATFVKLATVSGTTYSATGLTPNTTYGYVVRATDAAALLGPYSNSVSITTLATNPDLVAAYSFDEGSGTQAGDSSGTGNVGTIQGAAWSAAGKYANALSFNGNSALVTIADAPSLDLTTAMTLEAWVYPTVVDSAWRDVIYKGNDNYFLESTTSNGALPGAGAILGTTNSVAFGTAVLPANTWTHLAETYDGSTLRLYVNGTQAASLARTGNIKTSTNPLQIGGDSIFGQYFQGLIDEVRIYRVALTPTQIQTDMGAPLGGSLPIVTLSASVIDFGSHPTGVASAPQNVTLTNTGGAELAIGSISTTGANPGDFAQTNDCGSLLPPAGTCTITVTFTAAAAGARSAAITIADNSPNAPHRISLSGTGTGFSISPRTAVLTAAITQQFSTTGSNGGVIWLVDTVEGGDATVGTISTAGLYTPPAVSGTHTVTVRTSDGLQSSNAVVYVTNHEGVFTHHNDNARTGQNVNEIVLTPSNVSSATFGKLASVDLDGNSHASPLYVAGVTIPGQGVHNVVYVATEHNSVYALDADGRSTTPLWKTSFINPANGLTTVPSGETGECCDIAPEIGITGTPVIDSVTGTLYLVAKTKEVSGGNTNYRQRLHALDIATGAEKFGGPVLIQASVPGSGGGSQAGNVPFDALRENQRPALLLSNGVVYIGFGSHGDIQPYHGWLLGYDAATLQQVFVHNSSPNSNGAGMWQANGGPAADAAGNIYFITGNGPFDVNTGGKDYGDTFVKVSPSGTVADYFTPHNQANINSNNFDLGAAGPLLLPDQPGAHPHLIVSAGKDNAIYLVDRDSMGHYNSANDSQIVQSLVNIFPFGTPEPGNYSSPVYFNGRVYFGPIADTIQAFSLSNGLLSTTPTSASSAAYAYPGAVLSVSANGSSDGILWAIQRNGDCGVQITCGSAAPGVLRAYDASNLGVQLYASDQSGTRDALDFAAKFSVPLVVNGKVFVTTLGRLTIFGLLP
jgi:chitodextrinase